MLNNNQPANKFENILLEDILTIEQANNKMIRKFLEFSANSFLKISKKDEIHLNLISFQGSLWFNIYIEGVTYQLEQNNDSWLYYIEDKEFELSDSACEVIKEINDFMIYLEDTQLNKWFNALVMFSENYENYTGMELTSIVISPDETLVYTIPTPKKQSSLLS